MLWVQIGLVLGFLFVQACSKSVVDENILPITQIKLKAVGDFYLKSITYQEKEYKMDRGRYLIPYETGKDSIKIRLNFDEAKLSGWHQIPNHKREINQVYYLSDFADSTLAVADKHPMDDFKPEDGFAYVKIFGKNDLLFPDKKPFHLAIYGINETLSAGRNVVYTNEPIDTIFNISEKLGKEYLKIRYNKPYNFIKMKLLTNNREELLVQVANEPTKVRVYYFLPYPSPKRASIIEFLSGDISFRDRNDRNTRRRNPDNGVSMNSKFSQIIRF